MEEEDVDQLAGPVGVAVDTAGGSPEGFVGERERPGLPRPGQSGGARKGAGLGFEDLEIVIELDRLTGAGGDPLTPGSHGAAVEHHDLGCPQRDPDPPADEPARDAEYFTILTVIIEDRSTRGVSTRPGSHSSAGKGARNGRSISKS